MTMVTASGVAFEAPTGSIGVGLFKPALYGAACRMRVSVGPLTPLSETEPTAS
jgi:hypothetical protein